MLFADDAALSAHTEAGLQDLINCFSDACNEFGLTISIKKTNVLDQNVSPAPSISIGDSSLDVVEEFTYLGSVISSSLNLDLELNGRIGKAPSIMGRLSRRVWENTKLTTNTKIAVYQACVLSTLMYGSECWTLYSRQEQRLNAFHLRCIRRILGISWQQHITNDEVLKRAGIPSMFSILAKRRLRWLGHVARMEDGRIPKDMAKRRLRWLGHVARMEDGRIPKDMLYGESPLAQDPLVDQLSGKKMSANATSGLAILHLPTLKRLGLLPHGGRKDTKRYVVCELAKDPLTNSPVKRCLQTRPRGWRFAPTDLEAWLLTEMCGG